MDYWWIFWRKQKQIVKMIMSFLLPINMKIRSLLNSNLLMGKDLQNWMRSWPNIEKKELLPVLLELSKTVWLLKIIEKILAPSRLPTKKLEELFVLRIDVLQVKEVRDLWNLVAMILIWTLKARLKLVKL